ncbi:hypothetical protein GCM10027276_34550 [Comamonas piscis]
MKLTSEEIFALTMLFGNQELFEEAVIYQLDSAEVLERKETGVGYFAKIKFANPLPDCCNSKIWDWNFNHKNLKYGGSFIAYYEPPNLIELEAVVHDGLWPKGFDKSAFSAV